MTILEPIFQDGLVMLCPSDFNLQDINTNSAGIGMVIDGKIFQLAWHQLCVLFSTNYARGIPISLRLPLSTSSNLTLMWMEILFARLFLLTINK